MYTLKTSWSDLKSHQPFLLLFSFYFIHVVFKQPHLQCFPFENQRLEKSMIIHNKWTFLFSQIYIGLSLFHYIFFSKIVSDLSGLRSARAFEKVRQE